MTNLSQPKPHPPGTKLTVGNNIDVIDASMNFSFAFALLPTIILAEKYGGKLMLLGSVILSCAFTALIPILMPYGGWISTLILRIALGIVQVSC